jgi:hypothetical protein
MGMIGSCVVWVTILICSGHQGRNRTILHLIKKGPESRLRCNGDRGSIEWMMAFSLGASRSDTMVLLFFPFLLHWVLFIRGTTKGFVSCCGSSSCSKSSVTMVQSSDQCRRLCARCDLCRVRLLISSLVANPWLGLFDDRVDLAVVNTN